MKSLRIKKKIYIYIYIASKSKIALYNSIFFKFKITQNSSENFRICFSMAHSFAYLKRTIIDHLET